MQSNPGNPPAATQSSAAEASGRFSTQAAITEISAQATEVHIANSSNARMAVQEVQHDPPVLGHILYDQGLRLATMQRKKIGDFTLTAFWTALATGTSGISGVHDLLSATPTGSKLVDIINVCIFVIASAFTIFGFFSSNGELTSREYLDQLFKIPAKPKRWFNKTSV